MSERKYNPIPVDTSEVILPEELLLLTEKIAENVHDVWAAGRIAEGWTYDLVKDSEKKTTPLLVAYDELPENEKEYDRNTALETLKVIVKLGYEIRKNQLWVDRGKQDIIWDILGITHYNVKDWQYIKHHSISYFWFANFMIVKIAHKIDEI